MEKRELTCISCPIGCQLEVQLEDNRVVKVSGHTCKRGEDYGIKECTNPTRIVTTTVKVSNGFEHVVPVKTSGDIPKGKIMDCIRELKNIKLEAPVNMGDVILKNVANTGISIIATKNVCKA